MSKTEAVSVVGRLHRNRCLRFGVFPETRTDFAPVSYLDSPGYDLLRARWTEQGMLSCKFGSIRFLYDPTIGIFKLSIKKKEILSGALQTGQFGTALFFIELKKNEQVYGFGAASGKPDRNDQQFRLLNQDTLSYSRSQSSYSSFPFFLLRRGQEFVGIFWNSTQPAQVRTVTRDGEQLKSGVYITPLTKSSGPMAQDFFVFTGSIANILSQYFELTGKPCLPPLWALGYHQSRWSYRSSSEVLKVAKHFRKENIPCDAIHLDIHYMDRYRVFTWHPQRFTDPTDLHKKLDALGFHSVAIVDPGIAADTSFEIYLDGVQKGHFCKNSKGDVYVGHVWPGKSVFPDFTRKETQDWWASLHKALFNVGVSGIWNDMNDPMLKMKKNYDPLEEDIVHSKGSHLEVRNIYANLEAEASYMAFSRHSKNIRPWVLSRSAFCGIQKYAAVWTGDNHSSWKHLRENLYMVLNLSLSGVPYCGADVGGFNSGGPLPGIFRLFKFYKRSELFGRWIELGSLMPFFRIHTTLFSHRQEPWSFGTNVLENCRKHIQRRYRMLPYLYTLARDIHTQGGAWIRPLFYEFPEVPPSLESGQFLIGPALLAAPVLFRKMKTRKVYLPPGTWYEYESGTLYQGNTTHHFKTPVGYYPLFVKAGSILPVCYPRKNAKVSLDGILILEIYPAQELYGSVYLDDGMSCNYQGDVYTILKFEGSMYIPYSLTIYIRATHKNYKPPIRYIEFRLPVQYCYLQNGIHRKEHKVLDASDGGPKFLTNSFRVPYAVGKYVFRTNDS